MNNYQVAAAKKNKKKLQVGLMFKMFKAMFLHIPQMATKSTNGATDNVCHQTVNIVINITRKR